MPHLLFAPREMTAAGRPMGRWHYTMRNEETGHVQPIGPCQRDCPGHATADEACEHAREAVMASMTISQNPAAFGDRSDIDDTQCEVPTCAHRSNGAAIQFAWPQPYRFFVCPAHTNGAAGRTIANDVLALRSVAVTTDAYGQHKGSMGTA